MGSSKHTNLASLQEGKAANGEGSVSLTKQNSSVAWPDDMGGTDDNEDTGHGRKRFEGQSIHGDSVSEHANLHAVPAPLHPPGAAQRTRTVPT
jgi:hypothetical protein